MSGVISERGQQRAALVAATTASFLTPFLGSSINVALPAIGAELGMTAVQLSWVATAFLLASAVCLVPFGRIADLFGRRRIFLTGMIVFTLASLGSGFSHSVRAMITLRAIQGVGGAMIFGTGLVAWERPLSSPLLDVALLTANPVFAWSNLAALINYSATYAVTFLVSLYLQYVRGSIPPTLVSFCWRNRR